MLNFAIVKLLVRTFGDAGTNAMEDGVRERQIAATEMIDFMMERRYYDTYYERCQDQIFS